MIPAVLLSAPRLRPVGSLALLLAAYGPSSAWALDSDRDGIDDELDNCTDFFNPLRRDGDRDGYGDLCDGDLNTMVR